MKYFTQQKNTEGGFVILFSVLISSLILLISSGMFRVIQKEAVLSSYARESQRAFYAADSALECGLYVDLVGVGTPPTSPFSASAPVDASFECGGDTISSRYLSGSGGTENYDYPFVFRYYNSNNNDDNSCAYILVEKNQKTTDLTVIETRMTSVGFNTCIADPNGDPDMINIPDFDDPTVLERRISIIYNK